VIRVTDPDPPKLFSEVAFSRGPGTSEMSEMNLKEMYGIKSIVFVGEKSIKLNFDDRGNLERFKHTLYQKMWFHHKR